MNALLPLVVAGPLLSAMVALTAGSPRLRRALGLVVPAAVLVAAVALVTATSDGDVLVAQVAGWPAGVSISFAADLLGALMLALTSLLVLVCMAYAAISGDDRDPYYVPLALVLSAGTFGAFLTADLFNLFVLIEIALIPSYVLMTRTGSREELGAGRIYLTVNLTASTVFLFGVGLLYGTAGTVNLGQLVGAGAESGGVALATGVLLVALAIKAALVPVHGWLPRSYPYPSPVVTALFSGLLTKIGVYAIFRVYTVIFSGESRWDVVVVVVTIASMVVGVLGALGETTVRAVLAFHMVSQVGYIVLGVGIGGVVGLSAGIFYLLHHTVVKTSLFLSAGVVERVEGTGRIDRLGGLARRQPLLGVAFMGAALSLVGIPPFSGFVAKYVLIRAGVVDGQHVAAAVALVVSLFTLLSMLKVWNGVFWGGEPTRDDRLAPLIPPRGMVVPGLVLAALSLLVGVSPEWLLWLSDRAAAGLADPSTYATAVAG
ncbi:MAG TPA: monovalent cation/H+ antiporter subunit D family protein [Jiangellales bacterium]|nr:monovalent cation/H+ antiporter subunit D family protein [Jiangellales bacterium]